MNAPLQIPSTDGDWEALVSTRRRQIGRFLSWAAEREAADSMRLTSRSDIARVSRITDAFGERWWAAVVYSCFDSELGTLAVAQDFHDPVGVGRATRLVAEMKLPSGAVGGHRIQPAHKGAKVALVSACARAGDFGAILNTMHGFHDRYLALRRLQAPQWGRTTCYDLLVRTGQLARGSDSRYEPDRAPRRNLRQHRWSGADACWPRNSSRQRRGPLRGVLHGGGARCLVGGATDADRRTRPRGSVQGALRRASATAPPLCRMCEWQEALERDHQSCWSRFMGSRVCRGGLHDRREVEPVVPSTV